MDSETKDPKSPGILTLSMKMEGDLADCVNQALEFIGDSRLVIALQYREDCLIYIRKGDTAESVSTSVLLYLEEKDRELRQARMEYATRNNNGKSNR